MSGKLSTPTIIPDDKSDLQEEDATLVEKELQFLCENLSDLCIDSNNGYGLLEGLLTKLFPNCWLPIAFLDRRSCPKKANRLSVSVQSSGKKRLILDLRFVNKHVWKQKVKFEDLKVALNYFDKGHFMFSVVLKRGYHHMVIFPPHQTFWVFPGFTRVRSVSFVSGSCPSASVQPRLFSQRFLGLSLPTGGGMVFTLSMI